MPGPNYKDMRRSRFFTTLSLLLLLGGNVALRGENPVKTRIEGHWNHPKNSVQTIHVVSEGEDVELFINGISFGHGKQEVDSLYRFDNVIFMPGDLLAVSYDTNGNELSRHSLRTAGMPAQLILSLTENSEDFRANGTDTVLVQFEVADFQGNICGADDRLVSLEIEGPAEWCESVPQENGRPLGVRSIKAENGRAGALLRSEKTPGEITVTARAKGLASVAVKLYSKPVE